MSDYSSEKRLVLDYYAALDAAGEDSVAEAMARYVTPDFFWRGFHPFNEQTGPQAVAEAFWRPFRAAFAHVQRRQDIFIAGKNHMDGASTWVVSMGHLMGLLQAPWLSIPATGKMAFLRYCEFNRVEHGRITEAAMFFDIPHVMLQAGLNPFPPQTGAHLVQPGPMTHDGLIHGRTDPAEGAATLAAIDRMIGDIASWSGGREEPLEDELRRSWCEDMIWWGPAGIGASYTIPGYARQHSGPFREAFRERSFHGHVAKIAEGHFGGFFGWPNLTLTSHGGFMGMPATRGPAEMRVIDMYRRQGDKLAENWIFIDLLHFWMQNGLDVLGRMAEVPRT